MTDRAEHEARRGVKTRGERVKRTTTTDGPRGARGANALLDLSELGFERHYLGASRYRGDIAYTNDRCDAVAVFRPPIAASFNRDIPRPLECSRLFGFDDRREPLSAFLSACLRRLRRLKPDVSCVIAYADTGASNPITGDVHIGGIYRASNFADCGAAPATEPHWIDETGARINRQRVVRMLGTAAKAKVADARPDWTYVPGSPKRLFIFPLAMTVADVLAALEAVPRSARTRPFGYKVRSP
jgi:hypothetical protein